MELESIKRDVERVEEGVWINELPGFEGLRLQVRGMSNKRYKAALARLIRSLSRKDKDQFGMVKPEIMTLCVGKALHEAVLINWDGLTEGGQPLSYERKKAYILLTTPEYEPFQDAVVMAANIVDNMNGQDLDDAIKNLEMPSEPGSEETTAP